MITKHLGGETVKGGIYWSVSAGEFVSVPAGGGELTGGQGDRYVWAPLPLVLLVAPFMGLAFAIFLPLSGFLVLGSFLSGKLRGALFSGKVSAAHMAGARVQPGVSYLEPGARDGAEKRGSGSESEEEQEDKLLDLAKEIAETRWRDK